MKIIGWQHCVLFVVKVCIFLLQKTVRNKFYELKETYIGLEIWNCYSGTFHLDEIKYNHTAIKVNW